MHERITQLLQDLAIDLGLAALVILGLLRELPEKIAAQLEIDAKYDVYLARQAADIAAFRRDEGLVLPAEIDYARVNGLSNEARQKLASIRPRTIGQAGRIDGMTPAALTLLVGHVRGRRRGRLQAQ